MRDDNFGIQMIQLVQEESIRASLNDGSVPGDSVTELADFGKLLFGESHQRSGYIDSKLGNYLTWTSALLGILLLDQNLAKDLSLGLRIVTMVPIAFGLAALVLCYMGLRSSLLPTPSERDWFRDGIMGYPDVLCQYHLLSLLRAHQGIQKENFKKAQLMHRAEFLLMVTGALTGILVAVRTLSLLVGPSVFTQPVR